MAYEIKARQGDTFRYQVQLREDDDVTPISLAGCQIEFSVAPVPNGTPYLQFTAPPEVVISSAPNGIFVLTLTPTQTRALPLLYYVYEVTVTFSDSRRLTVLDGVLTVEKEVKA